MRDEMPAEANRYDGAPAPNRTQPAPPSKAEVESAHREFLRERGCKRCDETDPDNLSEAAPLANSCSALQHRYDPIVLCDDCKEARPTYRESVVSKAREGEYDAVAFYECDRPERLIIDKPTVEGPDGEEMPAPRALPNASVQIKCRCGAHLDDIVFLNEDDD